MRKRREAQAAAQPATFVPPEEDVPDLDDGSNSRSQYQRDVDEAVDSITLQEVYQRIGKNRYAVASDRDKTTGEGIKVSCPFPDHEDQHPSAWINAGKHSGK